MESPKHECEYCGRHFRRSYNLKRHLEDIHNRHADDIESSEPDVADEESSTHEESDTVSNTHEESDTVSNPHEESFIDSNTQETDAESVHSDVSMEDLNDGEWTSYTDCLDSAMMQVS